MAKKTNQGVNGDEGVLDLGTPVGPAQIITVPVDGTTGYGDDELAALEQLEEMALEPEQIEGDSLAGDAAVSALEERTERLAEFARKRHASRVHRKVSAAVIGGGIAGAIPALLEAVDALELPSSVQPFVVLAAAILGLFAAAYATPERETPEF